MPRKRWIDKNSAQTFKLLYRAQDDPLIHEDERELVPVGGSSTASQHPAQRSGLHINDLEDELDLDSMRENEGEAAEYGIYFDDTKYDYMQHLKDLGDGAGDAHFVDSMPVRYQGKGKGKAKAMKLEDALAQATLDDEEEAPSLVESSRYGDAYSSYTTSTKDRQLEQQQDVPDEIAGFQPDMDPRLREVLEALEDDAYVDDQDEDDIFGSLGKDGQNGELTLDEFEYDYTLDEDDGWESDATEKAPHQPSHQLPSPPPAPIALPTSTTNEFSIPDAEAAVAQDGDWLRDFAKHKRDTAAASRNKAAPPKDAGSIIAASAANDHAPTLYTLNGTPLRQKKRKGAQTNPSAYSMTSSSLARTDGQQLLDARFDKVEKMYAINEDDDEFDDDGGMSLASGMTGASKVSAVSAASFADEGAVRRDLDGLMDGFLGDWEKANPGGGAGSGKGGGKKNKRGKGENQKYGLQQLEEVRAELGPARLYQRRTKA